MRVDVANGLVKSLRMSDSWRKSKLVAVYKERNGTRPCRNYKRIKQLEHGIKVIYLRNEQDGLEEMQMAFVLAKGTVDTISSEQ